MPKRPPALVSVTQVKLLEDMTDIEFWEHWADLRDSEEIARLAEIYATVDYVEVVDDFDVTY